MKRTVKLVGGLGLAVGLTLGASSTASAHEQKPVKHHQKACHTGCHHAPKPPGGWPCSATHSCPPPKPCPPRHHHKPKPPVAPPTQVTPRPPVVSKPRTPAPATPVQHRLPATPAAPQTVSPSLPRTGGFYEPGLYGAAGLMLVGGGLLRAGRGSKWTVK